MRDTYSDTWSGNYWVGFGLNETITSDDNGGKSKSVNFTTYGCPEPEVEEVIDEVEEEEQEVGDEVVKDDDNVELDDDSDE
jgi:hypothetical protein